MSRLTPRHWSTSRGITGNSRAADTGPAPRIGRCCHLVRAGGLCPVGRMRLAGIISAAGLGLLVIVYGAAFALTGEKVPGDTTVLGISLGGMSEQDAKTKLQAGVKDRLNLPIKLTAGGRNSQIRPADAGLSLDVDATIEAAGAGRSLNPARMWQVLTGGEVVDPVV